MSTTVPRGSDRGPLVSVIVPVWNGEQYLERCLDSVLNQTETNFELIVIDDGSTDGTPAILRRYAEQHPELMVRRQENAGQGNARNRALELARGTYVLFVDADDFIERVTLRVVTERAEADAADLVHFDWKFVRAAPDHLGRFDYYNVEPFWHRRTLEGADCELLFRMHSYFSVTNLYRRSFLNAHSIRYEEGQIYEDNPFLARVFTCAERVSLVHSPLYAIQANPNSSTKTGTETDRHLRDHLAAVRKSFDRAAFRSPTGGADLAEYHLEKFSTYYQRRVPRHLRAEYAREFVEILAAEQPHLRPGARKTSWLTRLCVEAGVFSHRRPGALRALLGAQAALTPPAKRALRVARTTKRRLRHPLRTLSGLRHGREPKLREGSVLFLGFDGRFTGNSRALFEQMLADERFSGRSLFFATNDPAVAEQHRVRPGSAGLTRVAQSAEFVIAETWVPDSVPKHPDATWIQLWHGTPVKRMLFDSHEREITLARPQHKVNKYRDIQRWDLFVVDGDAAAERFSTAFLLPEEALLRAEYPRVERLLKRAATEGVRGRVLGELGLAGPAEGRRVVLYAPTWRDENYGVAPGESRDDSLLDTGALAEALGGDAVVLFKDHAYLRAAARPLGAGVVRVSEHDIYDLLLVSDVVITDYSSVQYDAAALGIPVITCVRDAARFAASRGHYGEAIDALALQPKRIEQLVNQVWSADTTARRRIVGGASSLTDQLLRHLPVS